MKFLKTSFRFFKSLYLHERFFYVLFGVALLFLISFWVPMIYPYLWLVVFVFALLVFSEIIALYKKDRFSAQRNLPEKFSNSDANPVRLFFENQYPFKIHLEVIDELPVQFQKRDFFHQQEIPQKTNATFEYSLRPVERGEYFFGKVNCYVSTRLKLVKRRFQFADRQMVKVFPSFVQMKKYDFLSIDNRISQQGLKKIRRIGHTMEFEQIKDYVVGDDVRTLNWKATAKHGNLMVNQFQDEKAQPVYSLIDTGRVMKMPFEGLKLLDYAINSSLAFSNIALKKNDKVGMLAFSNKIDQFLSANGKKSHLNQILNALYKIDTRFLDSDFGLLHAQVKRQISQRSLLLLYTNFEHISSLQRQLPYLRAVAKKHMLVVIFFENTELKKLAENKSESIPEIYEQTIASQFSYDKKMMVNELQKHGIQTILTEPKNLTINTINKYLEIKKRGMF
ncbi:MAG TPA: DUF58 domain-containing protein [Flavobacteriaceae bacterium]|nr:DUF58 domain-containing protein [Flavobacteriaceae bacterium]